MSDLPPKETPAHPPIAPPPAVAAAPPSDWPRVLGIIAIVLGSLGALGGCLRLAFPFVLGMLEDLASQGGGPDMFGTMREWQGWNIAASMLGMVIAVLLIVEGLGLLRRRTWSIRFGYCWAVLKMMFVLFDSILGYFIQQEMFQAMANQGTPIPMFGPGFFKATGALGVVLGIAWGWALPVFMIVWFCRAKIRADIAAWSAPDTVSPAAG